MALIVLVEDEKLLRWTVAERLRRRGHTVREAPTLADAERELASSRADVLLLDISLPDGNGLDFFAEHVESLDETSVVVMTAVGQIEDAVKAMKLGALDFLTKPVDHDDLVALVDRSVEKRSTRLVAQLARSEHEKALQQDIVAESPAFRATLETARQVADSGVRSVLILGESGTGKNVVAKLIHASSARSAKPLVTVNCAAIPDSLMESELLGHERGAFTDAKSKRQGCFELADNGTVMLDEVGELKLELQAKLLHVIEEQSFRRVGGAREIHVDVCVMALTNRDMKGLVEAREFRADLFYRLSVFVIQVPSLRERREDIIPLADHFIATMSTRYRKAIDGLSAEAACLLLAYAWPGNVRELRNVIERAMILEKTSKITPASLVLDGVGLEGATLSSDPALPAGIVTLEDAERVLVRRALDATGDNQTKAAELLDISRDQLRYRVKKFGW